MSDEEFEGIQRNKSKSLLKYLDQQVKWGRQGDFPKKRKLPMAEGARSISPANMIAEPNGILNIGKNDDAVKRRQA